MICKCCRKEFKPKNPVHRLGIIDAESFGLVMQDKKYDLLVSDPPYGVSLADKNQFLNAIDEGNRVQTPIAGDHQTPEAMSLFWKTKFSAVRKFASPGAAYYVTGPQGGDLLLLLLLALRESGFPLRHMLIWAKNNHVLGRCDYHYKHEPIIYGWVEGSHAFHGGHGETSLWEIDKPHTSEFHPTMKPIELFARAIRNSTSPDQIIADPFIGSGTAMLAAEQLGRVCYSADLDPAYAAVTLERMTALGLRAVLDGTTMPAKAWKEHTGKRGAPETANSRPSRPSKRNKAAQDAQQPQAADSTSAVT